MKKAMLFFAALLVAMGCSKEDTPSIQPMDDPNTVKELLVLSAVIDNDSLITNVDPDLKGYEWVEGDVVKLYRVEDGEYTGDVVELTYAKDVRFYISEPVDDGDYVAYFTGDWSKVTDPVKGGDVEFEIGAVQSHIDGVSRFADYILLSGELTVERGEITSDVAMSHRTAVLEFSIRGGDMSEITLDSPTTLSFSKIAINTTATISRSEPTNNLTLEFVQDDLVDDVKSAWIALSAWEISDVDLVAYSMEEVSISRYVASLEGSQTLVAGETIAINSNLNTYVEYFSEDSLFEISSAVDLQVLAKATNLGANFLNCTFNQTADIDLEGVEWTPIGRGKTPFKGIYNGNNFKIENIKIDDQSLGDVTDEAASACGLFGYVAGNSTNYATHAYILNVNLVSGSISANGRAVGGICGYSNSAQFIECYNGASVENRGSYTDLTTTIYTDDLPSEKITSYPVYAGGIVGKTGDNVTFVGGCLNAGAITANGAEGDSDRYVGGIVGGVGSTSQYWGNSFLSLCSLNTGSLDASSGSGDSYAGGIVGKLGMNGAYYPRCYIIASLHAGTSVKADHCGYITGYAPEVTYSSLPDADLYSTLRYCYAFGSALPANGSGGAQTEGCEDYLNILNTQEGWGLPTKFWPLNSHLNVGSAWNVSYIYWDMSSYGSVTSRPKLSFESEL